MDTMQTAQHESPHCNSLVTVTTQLCTLTLWGPEPLFSYYWSLYSLNM